MVATIELRTAVELFMFLSFLAASLLILAFRNRRNPVVGFRVGYTYHSRRAWKRPTLSRACSSSVTLSSC